MQIWECVEVNVPTNISNTHFNNAIKRHLLGNYVTNHYKSVKGVLCPEIYIFLINFFSQVKF